MFKGNPRKPGSHSFENIRFILDDERMSRLRKKWEEGRRASKSEQCNIDDMDSLNDEWIIAQLSSDSMTGLRHEINVLASMNILSIQEDDGKITLEQGWEDRVSHMTLIEMQRLWGTDVDASNLYCIHDKIKLLLESHWDFDDEDECWQRAIVTGSGGDRAEYETVAFDDVEYQLREQIFTENYYNWVNKKSGMGVFGI